MSIHGIYVCIYLDPRPSNPVNPFLAYLKKEHGLCKFLINSMLHLKHTFTQTLSRFLANFLWRYEIPHNVHNESSRDCNLFP